MKIKQDKMIKLLIYHFNEFIRGIMIFGNCMIMGIMFVASYEVGFKNPLGLALWMITIMNMMIIIKLDKRIV